MISQLFEYDPRLVEMTGCEADRVGAQFDLRREIGLPIRCVCWPKTPNTENGHWKVTR